MKMSIDVSNDHTSPCLAPCRTRLESEAEELTKAGDTESERLMDIYERLEELDAATAETKAARILHGLGQWVWSGRGLGLIKGCHRILHWLY